MSNKKKQAYEKRLEEDTYIKGIKQEKGTKAILGASCPRCGTHYPMSMRVVYCNVCGHRSKRLKPHEEKKKQKMLKRQQLQKQEEKNV